MIYKLNSLQSKGLNKLGDVMIPGDQDLPRFSTQGYEHQAYRVLDYLPTQDAQGLMLLLGVLGLLPSFLIVCLVFMIEKMSRIRGMLGAPFRVLWIGLKGLIMTLYYSGAPLDVIGFKPFVYTGDVISPHSSQHP